MSVFEAAGGQGWLCALDIDGPGVVAHDAEAPVVAASVIKVLIGVEFHRQVGAGLVDATERIRVRPAARTPGPTGFSTFDDEVEVSLRDLVRMMLVVSDNAATDLVLHRIGLAAVNRTAAGLGLTGTVVGSDLRGLVDDIARHAGFPDWEALVAAPTTEELRDLIATAPALTPGSATRTTARDMATLLRLIWRDEAVPPDGCAHLRRLMAEQVTRHRLATGFDPDVRVSAKSGSLLGVIRNEIGVVEYPDGGRYAVAVFTRAAQPYRTEHELNRAIGQAAAEAVERLRATAYRGPIDHLPARR